MRIKKYISLILFIIFPFTIFSVSANWVYYGGKVDSLTIVLPSVILGSFNFIPYPNEYPPTPEGTDNNNIFDHVSGGDVQPDPGPNGYPMPPSNDGISLTDPKSPINAALESTNIDRNKPYITSIDYFDTNEDGRINRNDTTAKEYFYGKNADPNISFIIVRETFDNWYQQTYSIYTSTVDLSQLQIGDAVQYVYKTQMIWTRNIIGGPITEGKYTVSTTGSVKGICTINNITTINNRGKEITKKFFDYNTFQRG